VSNRKQRRRLLGFPARKSEKRRCGVNRVGSRCGSAIDPVPRAGIRPRGLGQPVGRQCQCRRAVISIWRRPMAMREGRAMGFIKRHTMFRDPGNPLMAEGPAVRLVRLIRPRELTRSAHSPKVHPGRLLSRADGMERWGRGDNFRSYNFVLVAALRGSVNVSGGAQRAMREKKG
jgi:hypothetical protein